MNIRDFMASDHRNCDLLFADAEHAVSKNDWDRASRTFKLFLDAMESHFGIEEEDMFPAFEAATGIVAGPTEMMRMEHAQMRGLFVEMRDALEHRHNDDYLSVSETLLVLMQQHNIKEEQILYNMLGQHLSEDVSYWRQKLQDRSKH